MSLEPGELIERKYRIVRMIGEGGMGAVYEGENVRINRRVAIKVLHASFASNAEVVRRFEREAQAAGRIGNDHILEVLDLGELPNGDFFMVMEFLDGEELGKRIRARGRLTAAELAPIAIQTLIGLAAAHDAGIIHRDLKPDNIFLLAEKAGTKDFVKIIDFGISKFLPMNNEMRMTQTGAVMGTPYYMSPEQAHGSSEVDARSDLYAFGVILYEAVTGSVPFEASTFNQLLFKIVLSDPTPAQELAPDLDPAFATLIEKAMAREPAQRFQNAREFLDAILAWQQHGASVSVPPRAPATSIPEIVGVAGFSPSGSAPGTPVAPTGAQTSGNWASSQASSPAKRSKAPLFVALGVGAIVVIGGGAFAMKLAVDHSAEQASSAPAVSVAPPASASANPETTVQPLVSAAPTASESAVPAASAAPLPAPANAASAHPKKAVAATHHVAPRPHPKPKPKPKAKPKPKPAGATPDFGY